MGKFLRLSERLAIVREKSALVFDCDRSNVLAGDGKGNDLCSRHSCAAPLKMLRGKREGVPMLDFKTDIQAMTTFRRNPGKFMKQLKKTKRPLVLTINGRAEAVVQDAEAYQRLLDIAAKADADEGIRQGLDDVKKRRVRPARQVLEAFRHSRGIPG